MIRVGSKVLIVHNTEPDESWTINKWGIVTSISKPADWPYEVIFDERDARGRTNPLYFAEWELKGF